MQNGAGFTLALLLLLATPLRADPIAFSFSGVFIAPEM